MNVRLIGLFSYWLFINFIHNVLRGQGWLGFPDLWSGKKKLIQLIFNPCGEFRWSPYGPVSQTRPPHLHAGAPGIFSDLLRSVQMLKRECGAESNGKKILSKTATMVPEFAMENLPLNRTAALVPGFAAKDLPLGRTLWWWWWIYFICVSKWNDRQWQHSERPNVCGGMLRVSHQSPLGDNFAGNTEEIHSPNPA